MISGRSHLGGAVALACAVAVPAHAQGLDAGEVRKRLDAVDSDLVAMRADLDEVAEGYRSPVKREGGRLQRRLREAEIQAILGDHYRAAIVLLDVAERPELRVEPEYPQAIFLLAESLRQADFPRVARSYYLELAPSASGTRLAEVVLGLLETSSDTGDFSGTEVHVQRLKQSGVTASSAVDFAYGKALFRGADRDVMRLTRALELFRAVPANVSVAAPAAYYEGVTLVRQGRLEEALGAFEKARVRSKTHPDARRVAELASLSLGRLNQEAGNVSQALDSYQEVSQNSPYFADMLFEVAWVHVKDAEIAPDAKTQRAAFQRALDATELLSAAAPESKLFPDAQVLQGNLQIRLGAPETAYDTFQSIVDQYGGARSELETLLATRKDARAFFEDLVATDLEDLSEGNLLPPMVVEFALGDDDVATAVDVRKELATTEADLETSREMVRTLEAALQSEQRFGMFPGVRAARIRALSIQNRLLTAERTLLRTERDMMAPHVDDATRARLDAIRGRARKVEEDIASLPTSGDGIEGNRKALKTAYQDVDHRAFQQLAQVRNLQAQLVAVRLWMRNEKVTLPEKKADLNAERMSKAKDELVELEGALRGIQTEIERASILSTGDGGWARAERLRSELRETREEQARLLSASRSRLPTDLRAVAARLDQQREALRGVETNLGRLQARLEQDVEARVDEVRGRVLTELRAIEGQRNEYVGLADRAEQLLGPIAEQTVESVGSEFGSLVRKADVGILDVAWARKRERSDQVTELVQELQRRSSELESELADVLEDDE
ncbi:MAG: hypothetical protein AAFZ18_25760 [Myxococcota bacterium]